MYFFCFNWTEHALWHIKIGIFQLFLCFILIHQHTEISSADMNESKWPNLFFMNAVLAYGCVVFWIQDTALGKPREVYRVTVESSQCEDRLCASLSLTSATWAALSDGSGRLYLLRTGKRGDSSHMKWEVSIDVLFTAVSDAQTCLRYFLPWKWR